MTNGTELFKDNLNILELVQPSNQVKLLRIEQNYEVLLDFGAVCAGLHQVPSTHIKTTRFHTGSVLVCPNWMVRFNLLDIGRSHSNLYVLRG